MGFPAAILLVPSACGRWMEQLILSISRGPLGILGPILFLTLLLCVAWGKRAPRYVTAVLAALVVLLVVILLGYL